MDGFLNLVQLSCMLGVWQGVREEGCTAGSMWVSGIIFLGACIAVVIR